MRDDVVPVVSPGAGWLRWGSVTVSGVDVEQCALGLAGRLRRRGWSPGRRVRIEERDPVRRLVAMLVAIELDLSIVHDFHSGSSPLNGGALELAPLPELFAQRARIALAPIEISRWEARSDAVVVHGIGPAGQPVRFSGAEILAAAQAAAAAVAQDTKGSVLALLPQSGIWGLVVLLGFWAHPRGTVVLDPLDVPFRSDCGSISAVIADPLALHRCENDPRLLEGVDRTCCWFGIPEAAAPAPQADTIALSVVRRCPPRRIGLSGNATDSMPSPSWDDFGFILRAVHGDAGTLESLLASLGPMEATAQVGGDHLVQMIGEWALGLRRAGSTRGACS